MVTIGNDSLPGVTTTVESARSAGIGNGSPADGLILGAADLEDGVAEANEGYRVRTPARARAYFGADSPLTRQIINALREGAFPVYGMAIDVVEVVDEEVTLAQDAVAEAPVSEDAEDTTFEVGGVELKTVITLKDPADETPDVDEAYLNPVTGDYNLDYDEVDPATVTYHKNDYTASVDSLIESDVADQTDFVAPIAEHAAVIESLRDAVIEMEKNYNFAVVLSGVSPYMTSDEISLYESAYDTSRLQLIYPSRNAEGESIIGSYVGMRSSLGIRSSPMRNQLASQSDLAHTLSDDDMIALLDQRVNPVADERTGSRVVEDMTTATVMNAEESNMQQGLARLVVDYVTLIVRDSSDKFIGELHTQSARNALRNIIRSELKDLMELNTISAYTVAVQEIDSMTASVDVGIKSVAPLRNIEANVTAGEVEISA